MPYIWIAWDLLALAILAWGTYRCAKSGFVSTIISFAGYAVAAIAAATANTRISVFLYDKVIGSALLHFLTRRFNLMLDAGPGVPQDIMGAMPGFLQVLALPQSESISAIRPDAAESMAGAVLEVALKDPVMTVLQAVCFLVVFTLVALVMRWIARLLTSVNHIPVVGTLNTVLGGSLGVVGGCLTLYVTANIMRLVVTISGSGWSFLNAAVMDATYIWRVFY